MTDSDRSRYRENIENLQAKRREELEAMRRGEGGGLLLFDSAKLGHSARDSRIYVHYPRRDEAGNWIYGAGFDIGPIPEWYWSAPPNEITRERVDIWGRLLSASAATPG